MGDRTWFEITYPKDQDQLVRDVFNVPDGPIWEDEEVVDGILLGRCSEMNYGGFDEVHRLAELGLSFYGRHGSGGDYSEGVFASNGESIAYVPAIDGVPVVRIDENLGYSGSDYTEIALYWRLFRQVDKKFQQ